MGEREQMIKRLITRIKKLINSWHYRMCMIGIMSDAIEYGIEPDVVDYWLEANYENHYGR